MSHRRLIFLLFSCGILILGIVLLWVGFKPLTNDILRPWVAGKIGDAVSGEAELGALEIRNGQVLLTDLAVRTSGGIRLRIPEIEIGFSWTDLLARRLGKVDIKTPELLWEEVAQADSEKAPPGNDSGETGGGWPTGPPVLIDKMTVTAGQMTVVREEGRVVVRSINVQGGIGPRFDVRMDALVGKEAGVAVGLIGQGTWTGRPELTINALSWDGQSLLENPLTISPDLKTLDTTLSLDRVDASRVTRLLGVIGKTPPWPEGMNWDISAPTVSFRMNNGELSGALKTGKGMVGWKDGHVFWENLMVDVGQTRDRWTIDGEVGLPGAAKVRLSGEVTGESFQGVGDLTVPDPAELAAAFGAENYKSSVQGLTDFQLSGVLSGNREAISYESRTFSSKVFDRGGLTGDLSIRIDDGAAIVEITGLELRESGERDPLATAGLNLLGALEKKKPWTGKWTVKASAPGAIADLLQIELPEAMPGTSNLDIRGKLSAGEKGVSISGIELHCSLTGPEMQGEIFGRFAMHLKNAWQVDLTEVKIENFDYFSGDGSLGVGGGTFSAAGEIRRNNTEIMVTLVGKAEAKEALVGKWYGVLEELPLGFSFNGNWDGKKNRLAATRIDLDLAEIASARAAGHNDPSARMVHGRLKIARLEGRFVEILRRLSTDVLPIMKSIDLGGSLELSGSFASSASGWDATVNLIPDRVDFRYGEEARIRELTGELPIRFGTGEFGPSDQEKVGHLTWTAFSTKFSDTGPGRLDLALARNRVRLRQPFSIAVAGGHAALNSFHLGWTGEDLDLEASAKVENISLEKLSAALGWPTMAGELTANFGDIRYAEDKIFTGGGVTAEVFGGKFEMRNLEVRKPFSSYPTYHADIDFSEVDLERLTHTFEFGEINGIADGYVHGLRLYDGVPSTFNARFETRSEGTRNISVKAIKNLNTLSQGGMSAALSQGIYRFIDFYRYRKIGIVCQLANDVFHLEGIARKGADNYLIYGSLLPPRIDVIVSTPTISFREMVKRLQRIERTGG